MSWCNAPSRRLVLLSVAAVVVAGCGFRPLYAPGADGSGPAELSGAIAVETPDGELGFRLREALVKRLTPARADPPLLLRTNVSIDRSGLAIEQDDSITRYNLRLTVTYRLDQAGSRRTLTAGTVETIAAYNAVASQYQTLVSEREVTARAAEDAADKVVRRLAAAYDPAWLTPPPPEPAAAEPTTEPTTEPAAEPAAVGASTDTTDTTDTTGITE